MRCRVAMELTDAAGNQRPCSRGVSPAIHFSVHRVCPLSPAVIARVSQQAAAISAPGRAETCDGAASGSIRRRSRVWVQAGVMRPSSSIASSKKHALMQPAAVSRSAAGPGVDDRLHALRRSSSQGGRIWESLAVVRQASSASSFAACF